jgi:autotransporter translocation and assembly factor TamB
VEKLHLEWLPAFVVDPALHLGGVIDVDVKASGAASNPRVVARVNGAEVRFKGFTKIAAQLNATLADQRVDGALDIEGPFLKLDGKLSVPVDPLAGGPIDVAMDLSRLDLSDALRAATAARKPRADGRLAMKLHLTGNAQSPKVDVTINGRELQLRQPNPVAFRNIDVGRVQAHLTYLDHAARAEIDFSSAHGGTLRADATTRVDLSYPHVTRPMVVAKLPVRGKLAARNFDIAWIAGFSPRLQTMAGQLNADARIEGSVGDPQFVGDVRWKNGKVVALTPPAPASRP